MEHSPRRWASPVPKSVGDGLRALALPALLVAVASVGVYRTVTLDQSSWQGASFGMFATYDNPRSRSVHVVIDGAEGRQRAGVPAALQDAARRLAVVPAQAHARALAESILQMLADDGVTRVEVSLLRVIIWDHDGMQVDAEPLVVAEARR